jgi:hypothetical protein
MERSATVSFDATKNVDQMKHSFVLVVLAIQYCSQTAVATCVVTTCRSNLSTTSLELRDRCYNNRQRRVTRGNKPQRPDSLQRLVQMKPTLANQRQTAHEIERSGAPTW